MSGSVSTQRTDGSHIRPPPNRRRDKPQLSCQTCRRRKLKCDRKHPCSRCKKGRIESSCSYENRLVSEPSTDDGRPAVSAPNSIQSLELNRSGTGYREGFHWSTVLNDDPVSRPGQHHGAQVSNTDGPSFERPQGVLLLQGCKSASKEEILSSVPTRSVADRLVAHYFSSTEYSLCIVHRSEFLKQYEAFWRDPHSVLASWLGMLFSIICISKQFQNPEVRLNSAEQITDAQGIFASSLIQMYRERIVQCLVISQYSKGGPFVIETMIHYLIVESYFRRDSDIEIWMVLGTILQVAMRMGYHRDPCHFRSISAFDGEMRRRAWSTLYQMDLTISTQLGMPRIIRDSIVDMAEPLSLLDSDFTVHSERLPSSRPDDEITPALILRAKGRLMRVFGGIAEALTSVRPVTYAESLKLDSDLNDCHTNIPEVCKHKPLSLCIMDSSKLICQRIYIEILFRRAQILLHQKYFALSRESGVYEYSRKTAVEAALDILRYKCLLDEESQPEGRIDAQWTRSSFLNHEFLLATSVVYFYARHFADGMEAAKIDEICDLSRKAEAIWSRTRLSSAESKQASDALRLVLNAIGPKVAETQCHLPQQSDERTAYPPESNPLLDFQLTFPTLDMMLQGDLSYTTQDLVNF